MAFTRPNPNAKKSKVYPSGIKTLVEAEKMMQIAILLPCAAFIGWLLGYWLGSLLHQPWMPTAGIIFGGVSGLVYVVRLVMSTKTVETEPEDQSEDTEKKP
jgi:F0F1-type ATP synthase assembly protein I